MIKQGNLSADDQEEYEEISEILKESAIEKDISNPFNMNFFKNFTNFGGNLIKGGFKGFKSFKKMLNNVKNKIMNDEENREGVLIYERKMKQIQNKKNRNDALMFFKINSAHIGKIT